MFRYFQEPSGWTIQRSPSEYRSQYARYLGVLSDRKITPARSLLITSFIPENRPFLFFLVRPTTRTARLVRFAHRAASPFSLVHSTHRHSPCIRTKRISPLPPLAPNSPSDSSDTESRWQAGFEPAKRCVPHKNSETDMPKRG